MIRYRTPARSDAERRQRAGFARWYEVYDCEAAAWWAAMEYETCMYHTEMEEYRRRNPPPQLKVYMLATAGQPRN